MHYNFSIFYRLYLRKKSFTDTSLTWPYTQYEYLVDDGYIYI